GHSDPPIRMGKVWLNDVPAYAGIAAVDAYIGATELSESKGFNYGGAHVIEDLISGKKVRLRATSYGTDCYPRKEITTDITLRNINQAYLFNPRNVYQNYGVAVNSTEKTIYTYMGTLLPNFGNATYSTAGELSPLLNDPYYRTIGIGTRIFLGGGVGYVAWEGTQHNPLQNRADNGIPVSSAGTLALIGDLKQMSREYLRAALFDRYGVSMYVGVGIPIPILDEEMVRFTAVSNKDIKTTIFDYGVARRSRPNFGQVSYQELRSGSITINGKTIPTAPLSSLSQARKIATTLKQWITEGAFQLTEPVQPLPAENNVKPLEIRNEEEV
ncbi:MAG TPA: homocysteine biosynthesis protein, partial [Bacillota bacterium]|nr:homocysteine biosynthesis protein [Bacillota bacterium]